MATGFLFLSLKKDIGRPRWKQEYKQSGNKTDLLVLARIIIKGKKTVSMPAILKSKHEQFCNWLQNIRAMKPLADAVLDELEKEIGDIYTNYQQKMKGVKQIIHEYEEKQKAIRNRIKRNQKYNIV